MSSMQINEVLAQIRALSASTAAVSRPDAPAAGAAPVGGFGTLLKQGIEAVNRSQLEAGRLADAWERGTEGVDLARVMIEMQKASVSFRALTEVRNRLVSAYQDIMNMPI
ncbi:MAG: flagellar hook-basal body complex protein FliE [Gammaproteobacteria bacterium]|nr:flagellar hook-basal body complex protein FliE [Gammaproteobacteria bacterium]